MSDHSPAFDRYIGIDYSGAQTPDQSLKGLRAYVAYRSSSPAPPPSPRKYWTRKGLAQWLVEIFREDIPTIVGIDHSFSFPIRYFETHHILPDWQTSFSMTSRLTGPQIATTRTLISSGMGVAVREKNAAGEPVGDGSQKSEPVQNQFFTSTFPIRWPSLPRPVCPGCGTCGGKSVIAFSAGRSTAGMFLRGTPLLLRSTHPCGAKASQGKGPNP